MGLLEKTKGDILKTSFQPMTGTRTGITLGIAGRFALFYLLLAIPWPFMTGGYMEGVRKLGATIFSRTDVRSSVSFELLDDPRHLFNARITIINPALIKPDGSGPVRNLDFDSRSILWNPCAILLSLLLATPVSWNRRLRGIALGMPFLLFVIYLFVRFLIWDESSEIGLAEFSPLVKISVDTLRQILVMDSGLVIPVILWIITSYSPEVHTMFTLPKTQKTQDNSSCPDGIRRA